MATPLVRISELDPGTDFKTSLTNREGIVISKPHLRHEGVECVLGEEEKLLHENVLVIPAGRAWQQRRVS